MEKIAWIFAGPLADGQFHAMDEADLQQAEREGWAQDAERTGSGLFPSTFLRPILPGRHLAAEAFAARKGKPGKGGYPTRELEAAPRPAPASDEPEPELEPEPAEGAKTKPAKPKPKPQTKPKPK